MIKEEYIDRLITALERISHGGIHGATGLEALTMVVGGDPHGGNDTMVDALCKIASSIELLAHSVQNVSQAIADDLTNCLKDNQQ